MKKRFSYGVLKGLYEMLQKRLDYQSMNNAIRTGIVVFLLCAGVSCSRQESQVGKEIPLDDGVFMKVSRVRTWESYFHDVLPLTSHQQYEHWASQGSKGGGYFLFGKILHRRK